MPPRRHPTRPGRSTSIRRCTLANGFASVPAARSDPPGAAYSEQCAEADRARSPARAGIAFTSLVPAVPTFASLTLPESARADAAVQPGTTAATVHHTHRSAIVAQPLVALTQRVQSPSRVADERVHRARSRQKPADRSLS